MDDWADKSSSPGRVKSIPPGTIVRYSLCGILIELPPMNSRIRIQNNLTDRVNYLARTLSGFMPLFAMRLVATFLKSVIATPLRSSKYLDPSR